MVARLWYSASPTARIARMLLLPPSWLFKAVVHARNAYFSHSSGARTSPAIPVVSLGNLTVGGTGKTPMSAWTAARLKSLGGKPAIVMRGYGGDESLVHARLNRDVPVIADGDRIRGVETARAGGADVAILDDGFQHRRLERVSDWVLISVEQWRADSALLPAGPLREPISGLSRADVIIVTRKSATAPVAAELASHLSLRFPRCGVARCHFALDGLVDALTGIGEPLQGLRESRLLAIAAVGQPSAFFSQLEELGSRIVRREFPDHHAFTASDAAALALDAARIGGAVCTLKDAVKLAPLWPRAGPTLWYVSQIAVIEGGESVLDDALRMVLARRSGASPTAGSAGPIF